MIHKTKELVTGENRDRRHGCGEWSFAIKRKSEVVGPCGDLGGHRGGSLWLLRKKIRGLSFVRFEIEELSFAAVRIDQEFPTAVAHREGGTLVLRFSALENRMGMAVLPEDGLGRGADGSPRRTSPRSRPSRSSSTGTPAKRQMVGETINRAHHAGGVFAAGWNRASPASDEGHADAAFEQ